MLLTSLQLSHTTAEPPIIARRIRQDPRVTGARHLVQQWRVPASAITLIAFNKRAQEEIAARTADVPGLQIRTLNAIALAVINGSAPFARQPQRFNTIDEPEMRRIIGRLVKFPRVRNADPVATWLEALSLARLGLVDPAKVEGIYDGEVNGFADAFADREHLARSAPSTTTSRSSRPSTAAARPGMSGGGDPADCCSSTSSSLTLPTSVVRLLAGPTLRCGVGDGARPSTDTTADPAWLIEFSDLFGAGEHREVSHRCPGGTCAPTRCCANRRRVAKVIRAFGDAASWSSATGDPVDVAQAVTTAIAAGSPLPTLPYSRAHSLLAPVQLLRGRRS